MSDEKKIKDLEKRVKIWLREIEDNNKKLNEEQNEVKKEKLRKKIKSNKTDIKVRVERLIEAGGELTNIMNEASEFQRNVLLEIYSSGTDSNTIAIEKEIGRIKKMLHEDLKKAMEKDDYNPNDPIEIKRKSKLFKQEVDIGRWLLNAGDESLKDSFYYRECWNYTRDYEKTKDKYFTKEEQQTIERCVAARLEDKEYLIQKNAFLYNLGLSISEAAGKIGEWGDITQARVWVNNMRDEVFPEVIRQMYGKLPKKEAEERALEMTREYVRFIWDDAQIEELNRLYEETEREADLLQKQMAEGSLNLQGKERREMEQLQEALDDKVGGQRMIVLYLLREKIGLEKTYFIFLYRDDHNRELRKELFRKYTMEELGL